jgi:hypothetical protein
MPAPNAVAPGEGEEFEFRNRAEQEKNFVPQGVPGSGSPGAFSLAPYKSRAIVPNAPGEDTESIDVPWSDTEKKMAGDGIDIVNGVPYSLRNRMDMVPGATEEDKKNMINQYYGRDVGVAKNSYGELEYTSPATGRRTLVNPHSAQLPTVGSATDFAGQALGGAIGGTLAIPTGNPLAVAASSTLGAAGGQAVVDAGKYIVSKSLGLAPQRTAGENISSVGKDVGEAAGSAAAGEALGGLWRAGRFALTGTLSLKYKNAVEMQGWLDGAQSDLDDYYSLVGGNEKFRLSVPELLQTSDNPAARLRSYQEQEHLNEAYRSLPDLRAQERERLTNNLTLLQRNFQDITDNYKPPNFTPGQSGDDIKNSILAKKQAQFNQAQLQQQITQENAKRQAQGLPAWTTDDINQRLTGQINQVEAAGKDRLDAAYTNLKVQLGVPAEIAGLKSTDSLFQAQAPKVLIPLSPVTQLKLKNFYANALAARNSEDTSIGDGMLNAIPNNYFADRTDPLKGLNLDGQFDMFWTVENVQDLRAGIRQAAKSSNGNIQPRDQDMIKMADLMEENVRDYFDRQGNPGVLDAWENAQQEARNYSQNFRNNILSQVMEKRNGFPVPTYNQAVSRLLMNNGRGQPQQGVQELSNILQGDPEARNDVRNMIWSLYKDQGYLPKDGIPTRDSWAKFQDDFEGPIKAFFDKDDVSQIKSYEDMTDLVTKANKDVKNFNMAWRNSSYGPLGTPNSNSLTNAVFSPSISPDKLKGLGTYLYREQPDLLESLKGDTASRLAKMVSDKNGIPIPSKINAVVAQYGDRISEIMGPDYLNNVKYIAQAGEKQSTLNTRLGLVGTESSETPNIFQNVVRWLIAPPMSGEGRGVTALWNFRKRAAGRVVYNALSSPEGMQKFIMNRDLSNTYQVAHGILGDLGGQALVAGNQQ